MSGGYYGSTIKNGSKGYDVTKWQKYLYDQGYYTGTIDGDFGDVTDEATKQWQLDQGITNDGIVGSTTWGKAGFKYSPTAQGYTPTEFNYDVNEDALYEQLKNQYIKQGELASEDVMGKAAALTGGYGNSFATSAGAQAYNSYLEDFNSEVAPSLYQLAYDKYSDEEDAAYQRYLNDIALEDSANENFDNWYADYIKGLNGGSITGGGGLIVENSLSSKVSNPDAWKVVEEGGANAVIVDTETNTRYTLEELQSKLIEQGMPQAEAERAVMNLQKALGILSDNDEVNYDILKASIESTATQGTATFNGVLEAIKDAKSGGNITSAEAEDLIGYYLTEFLTDEKYQVISNGGLNWGLGIDRNGTVLLNDPENEKGLTFTLEQLKDKLVDAGLSNSKAKEYIKGLQTKLGITGSNTTKYVKDSLGSKVLNPDAWRVVGKGGANLYGIDQDAVIVDTESNTHYTLKELRSKLMEQGMTWAEAERAVMNLQKTLGISWWGFKLS